MIKKIWHKFWAWCKPYLKPKMIPFLLIAWCITNGWSYAFVVIGTRLDISWMIWAGATWISFLWFPLTAEKIITIFIAGLLYRMVYKEKFKKKEA